MNDVEALGLAIASPLSSFWTLPEMHFVLCVCRHETSYGRGWKPPGVGSHNWGAVQTFHPATVPHFSYGDSHANGQKYSGAFRSYASDAEGLADAARIILKPDTRERINEGDGYCAVVLMREHHYFEASTARYLEALERNYVQFLLATGAPSLLRFTHATDTEPPSDPEMNA